MVASDYDAAQCQPPYFSFLSGFARIGRLPNRIMQVRHHTFAGRAACPLAVLIKMPWPCLSGPHPEGGGSKSSLPNNRGTPDWGGW